MEKRNLSSNLLLFFSPIFFLPPNYLFHVAHGNYDKWATPDKYTQSNDFKLVSS